MFNSPTDLRASYQRFIERSTSKGFVFYLSTGHTGPLMLCSHTERFKPEMPIIPVWSDRPYAEVAQIKMAEVGRPCEVIAIPVPIFAEDMLHYMQQNGFLVGPNWNADFRGLECIPLEVATDFFVANGQPDVQLGWPSHQHFDPCLE